MKILIDMNLSPQWVTTFAEAGFEAVHWADVGNPAAPDKELFDWAKENGFMVFTHDLDFGAILAATQAEGPSVIQVRTQNNLPEVLGEKVIELIQVYGSSLEKGALITLDEARARVRILPIR